MKHSSYVNGYFDVSGMGMEEIRNSKDEIRDKFKCQQFRNSEPVVFLGGDDGEPEG